MDLFIKRTLQRVLPCLLLWTLGISAVRGQENENGTEFLKNRKKIPITKLTLLNSGLRETNLSISPDGKYMFFMSDRGGMPWSVSGYTNYKGKPRYDGDIWYSKKENDEWQTPRALGRNVNSSSGEDEPNISPDGQSVIFQSWSSGWAQKGGPYYEARLNKNTWSKPVGLGSGITRFFSSKRMQATDGVAVSPDRKTFIVACGYDYSQAMDLYISQKNKGKWSIPRKLDISTAGDERSAFLAGDGRTLFFASDGYGGEGGLDIYRTTLNPDGTCGPVVNLGKPFNTKNDDYGFIITASGKEAYFVRDGDIYMADLEGNEIGIKPDPTMIITGKIGREDSIEGNISLNLIDPGPGKVIATSRLAYDGTFTFAIPEREGKVRIQSPSQSLIRIDTLLVLFPRGKYQEMTLPPLSYKVIKKDDTNSPLSRGIPTKLIEKKSFLTLDIHFDYDQSDLSWEYTRQIDELYSSLKYKEIYLIKIIGHTDDKGKHAYNARLGMRRAEAVATYLKGLGVPERWLRLESRGENDPRADNSSSFGAFQNRRVEVWVVY